MTDPMELAQWLDDSHHDLAQNDAQARMFTEAAACIREMVEWRPIETAKEGVVVMGFWPFKTFGGHVITTVVRRPDGRWVQKWDHEEVKPTHWLPLPPAPGAEDE